MNPIIVEFDAIQKPILLDISQDYDTILNQICTQFGFRFHHQVQLLCQGQAWDKNFFYTNLEMGLELQLVFNPQMVQLVAEGANHHTLTHLQDSLEYHQFYQYFLDQNGFLNLQSLVLEKPMEPCVRALATCFEKHPELTITQEIVELMLGLQNFVSSISIHAIRILLLAMDSHENVTKHYRNADAQSTLLILMNTRKLQHQSILLQFLVKLLQKSSSPVDLYQDLVYKGLKSVLMAWKPSDTLLPYFLKLSDWIKSYFRLQVQTPVDYEYLTDRLYFEAIRILIPNIKQKDVCSLGLFGLERMYELIFLNETYFEAVYLIHVSTLMTNTN
jgi:hypothetical protein